MNDSGSAFSTTSILSPAARASFCQRVRVISIASRNRLRNVEQLEFRRHGLARKCLYAADGRGRIFGGRDNNAQAANQLFILHPPQDQLRATQNRGQRIIKVMRHARGQLAQRS